MPGIGDYPVATQLLTTDEFIINRPGTGTLQVSSPLFPGAGPASGANYTGNQTIDGSKAYSYMQSLDSTAVSYTINSANWPYLGWIIIEQGNTGAVQLNQGANVSLNFWITGHIGTGGQNAVISLLCTGTVGGVVQITVMGATA